MSDSMMVRRKFRTFNVMGDCSREALAIKVDTSPSSKRIRGRLNRTIDMQGKPSAVSVDNGSKFTSKHFELWAKEKRITIQHYPAKKTNAKRIH